MAPDITSVGIEDFTLGVQARNLSLVKGALNAGVQPHTSVNGRHPLWVLLASSYDELPEGLQTGMTRDEFASRTSEIIDALFQSGVKVAEEGKYKTATHAYLADRFLLSDDLSDASTIVLHAIEETLQDKRPVYQPDFARIMAGLLASGAVPESGDYQAIANGVVDQVAKLHEAVRERLLNPKSDLEKEVASAGEQTQYWLDPMQRPDMVRLLAQLGLGAGGRVVALPSAQGNLTEKFDAQAEQAPAFVVQLPKKSAKEVLSEMNAEFTGLDALKKDAQRLAFRQTYDAARAAESLAPTDTPEVSTAYLGYDGVGKSTFARKQAELLVALDLAGPNMIDITHDNIGKIVGSYHPKVMAQYFAKADIIHLELSGGARDKDGKNIDDYIMDALQISLDARKKPPVLFISGWPEDVDAALENNPPVKALLKKFVTIDDPSIEQLGLALDKRLAGPGGAGKPNLVLDKDARDLVLREFVEARKRFGTKGFRNMREVDLVAEKVPDALAERLFGSGENEQALAAGPERQKALTTVKAEDIKALNLRKLLGGPALVQQKRVGFTNDM